MLTAACRGESPTAPPGPAIPESPRSPLASELRIGGVPPALAPGTTAQLSAQAVLVTGAVRDCAAVWSVDNASVATVSPSGLLTGGNTGYVNVTASCEGLTARTETKVEALRTFNLSIFPYDKELEAPPAMKLVRANMEFLDGPRAGQRVAWTILEHEPLSDVAWPVKVRFTAESYEPKEFILSEVTGRRRNSMSPLFDFHVPMTFVPDAMTDTYVRTMSETESVIAHPFTMRAPGAGADPHMVDGRLQRPSHRRALVWWQNAANRHPGLRVRWRRIHPRRLRPRHMRSTAAAKQIRRVDKLPHRHQVPALAGLHFFTAHVTPVCSLLGRPRSPFHQRLKRQRSVAILSAL